MKRLWVIMAWMLMTVLAAAQVNVQLDGQAANAAGKRIAMYCYEDMLTQTERLVAEDIIDSAGRFHLGFYVNYPRLVYVEVECYSQSFYVEPGRHYEVYLPQFDWDIADRQNVYLAPVALPLEFLNLPANELNLQMLTMERTIDSVLDTHRVWFDFRFRPQKRYFDTLVAAVNRQVPDGENTFMNRYKEYTLAQLRLAMGFATRSQTAARHIAGKTVLYHDEAYMQLLFALYADAISQGMRKVPLHRLIHWVETGDLRTYIDSVGTDPLFYDEQLRELAVLVALKESYYDSRYNREAVARMVDLLGKRSKFSEHRRLAGRLSEKWSVKSGERRVENGEWRVENGERSVWNVELPDVEGNRVALDSLKGNWVYMSFVKVNDPSCQRELETLAHFKDSIYNKYDSVRFVTVCCDREFQKMYHLLRNSKKGARYNWTWLHFDGQYRWLEQLRVVSYPTFILLDPQGRRVYELAPTPESGFLLHAPWNREEKKSVGGQMIFENR